MPWISVRVQDLRVCFINTCRVHIVSIQGVASD